MEPSSLLADFCQGVEKQNLGVHGIVVRQHGDILAQHRWQAEERVQLYSASKTFTSMAIGIAIEESYVSLDTPVVQFFPESLPLQPDSRLFSCTVRHLLTMTSGHGACPLDGVMGAMSGFSPDREKDWVKLFFQGHMQYEPGTRYFYDNSATYLLSAIVSRTTGQSVRDFLLPRVFEPLDIYNPQWETCPLGICLGAMGLYLTTEQLSRFGQLLLQEGRWKGKQLIPSHYIHQASCRQSDPAVQQTDPELRVGYGYQIWRNTWPNSYRLDGMFGQFCLVLPDQDAVIAITSHEEKNPNDILRLVWQTLAPHL